MRFSLDWFKENFGLVATLVGFIVDTITLIALINSKVPPSIPFIDYPLGVTAQLTIWVIAAITYLGFLRGYWLQLIRRFSTESAQTFLGFLIHDMLLRFRHPFLLLPIIILTGFLIIIAPELWTIRWIFICAVVLFCLVLWSIRVEQLKLEKEWNQVWELRKTNNELVDLAFNRRNRFIHKLSNQWIQRIEERLANIGYTTDFDLTYMYNQPISVTRKALQTYHAEFETDKNLVLIKEKIQKRGASGNTDILLVAPRTLVNSKPWLEESDRYFFKE